MSDSAFPRLRPHDPTFEYSTSGLTKREYAAIHLLPSVILADDHEAPADALAARAVELADAVLRRAGE